MRGRTNVGDGVTLNANTQNMIVGSGQITAGDFVQYNQAAQYLDQSEANDFQFNLDGYAVSLKKNGVALFKNNEQVDYYTGFNISHICEYNGWIIFVSDSVAIGVLEINTTTDEIELVDSIAITRDGYDEIVCCIGAGGGKVVVGKSRYQSSNTYYRYYTTCDIANDGSLSNAQNSGAISFYAEISGTSNIDYYNGDFYLVTSPRGWATTQVAIYKLVFNESGVVTSHGSSGIDTISYATIGHRLYKNNNVVIYADSYSNHKGVIVVNYEGKTSYISLYNEAAMTYIDGGLLIMRDSSNCLKLYRYNNDLENFSLLFTTAAMARYDFGYLLGNDAALRDLASNQNILYRIFNIINGNEIQSVPNTNYVMPYTIAGTPIGIAKTDGQIGDTIPIYVPQMNA